jgi:hypothetical protein
MNEKTTNHMKAPQCASFVANMRQNFTNAEVTVLYVKENDVCIGAPLADPELTQEMLNRK